MPRRVRGIGRLCLSPPQGGGGLPSRHDAGRNFGPTGFVLAGPQYQVLPPSAVHNSTDLPAIMRLTPSSFMVAMTPKEPSAAVAGDTDCTNLPTGPSWLGPPYKDERSVGQV